ncbi:MAG: efflux RND transporter permease subunit [Proteobacteria bacterium]|nr:efflux RND transporter permease subunit [Pseudomonadota bacterium]
MYVSKLSIQRPIMMTMGLAVFFLFGALAYMGLSLNLFPDVEIPYVTIQTVYPGAGPKEIEIQVSKRIEDAVSTIGQTELIQSFSMESVSYVMMKFELGKDRNIAVQEVRDKVSTIVSSLPDDAQTPVIEKIDIAAFPIMDLVLTGPIEKRQLFEIADKMLKDRLSQIEGVGKVDIIGGQEREIRMEFDNRTVFQNKISLPQLSQVIAANNFDMPGGQFQTQSQELSVRLKGIFPDLESIRNLEIPTAFGMKKAGKLANIFDAGTEIREKTTFFNTRSGNREDKAILLSIVKSVDGNTVEMAEEVLKKLPALEKELPNGCKLRMVREEASYIQNSVSDTLSTIVLGVLLTGLVLLFFLHDLRSTLIVAISMPFSIISTFLVLQLSGFSLNMMTLMGLSTAVGVLVTNSVVVLENIFRHKGIGKNRKEAADVGTSETAVAVFASALTNIVVFLPIASMSSMIGQFFKEFALTVTYATVFSILASFTITPMLASLILPEKKPREGRISRGLDAMFAAWERVYGKLLAGLLKNRKRGTALLVLSFALFVGVMVKVAPKVGFEFFPIMDQGDVNIEVELPEGYNLGEAAALLQTIEDKIAGHPEVERILTTLGSMGDLDKGTNLALAKVKLIDSEKRDFTSVQMVTQFIEDLSVVPNAVIRVTNVSSGGDSGRAPISFYLLGQDVDKLEDYKRRILDRIRDIPGLINLKTSSKSGKPEITLVPDRRKVTEAGLTVMDLAMTLRASVEGLVATKYRESGNEYELRIKLAAESINTPEKIGNLAVVSPRGIYKLSQLAEVTFTEGYSKILHKDKANSIEFSGYTAAGVPLGDVVERINARTAEFQFEEGYRLDWGGDAEMMQEAMIDMSRTFVIALVLTFMLLAAILESFTQPLMILMTVPLALIGVFSGLVVTGSTMNIISMLAIVMLLGIVVNNAILLLDYTNLLRKQGKTVREALIEACPTKLKPIVMSTVAILFSMLPMALGMGSSGTEMRQPMGIVSIGGLIVSAVMTLFVIPAIYFIFSREKRSVSVEQTVSVPEYKN